MGAVTASDPNERKGEQPSRACLALLYRTHERNARHRHRLHVGGSPSPACWRLCLQPGNGLDRLDDDEGGGMSLNANSRAQLMMRLQRDNDPGLSMMMPSMPVSAHRAVITGMRLLDARSPTLLRGCGDGLLRRTSLLRCTR